MEELRMCNQVGAFYRFGEQDLAFVCDFCDGHLVWEDLEKMPSVRTAQEDATWAPARPARPPSSGAGANSNRNPHWQAIGFSQSQHDEKQVVFGPVAIANHIAPEPGDWLARMRCTFCDDMVEEPRDQDDEEEIWRPDSTFDDVTAFQEHLEWQHTQAPSGGSTWTSAATENCTIM